MTDDIPGSDGKFVHRTIQKAIRHAKSQLPAPPRIDALMLDHYTHYLAARCDHMDRLATVLIAVELTIPGIFGTAVKLTSVPDKMLLYTGAVGLMMLCWLSALLMSLWSLMPRSYLVNPQVMEKRPVDPAEAMGIIDFLHVVAQDKRRLLSGSCVLFFVGVASSILSLYQ